MFSWISEYSLVAVGAAILLTVGGYFDISRARRRGESVPVGWKLVLAVTTVYLVFLVFRVADDAGASYRWGTVVGTSYNLLPPGYLQDSASRRAGVTRVRIGDDFVEVGDLYRDSGDDVCVRESLGRLTGTRRLEVVADERCDK